MVLQVLYRPCPSEPLGLPAFLFTPPVPQLIPPPPPPPRSAAQTFLASCSSPVEALAKALAKITGITAMRPRSLINADEGVTTLLFTCEHEVTSPSAIWGYLRSERGE